MSYRTIAAALALKDVSVGERLAAYSLASYADAELATLAALADDVPPRTDRAAGLWRGRR